MDQTTKFIERRKEYRLPFSEKMIFTDGSKSTACYISNISRGGLFVNSLEPFPIDTTGYIAFMVPSHPTSLCIKAKVVHIVFDRQRCEVDCGMGFQFMEVNESHRSILNLHVLNEQSNYLELKKLLAEARPDLAAVEKFPRKMPALANLDLLGLRYKVNRICTIFEPSADPFAGDGDEARRTA